MKIKNIGRFIKSADKISHGVDWLTLNLKTKYIFFKKPLKKMKDNSVIETEMKGFCVRLIKNTIRNGSCLQISILIDGRFYKCFQYLEYNPSGFKLFGYIGSLTYYGTYFRLLSAGLLEESFEKQFFEDYMTYLLYSTVSRIDYRIDFFYLTGHNMLDKNDIVEYKSDTPTNIRTKGDRLVSWNLGKKNNKSVFIRCYDKLVEILKDGDGLLYKDYFEYENVFRLEIECGGKFNKRESGKSFTYAELSDLKEKARRFLGLSERIIGENFLYQYKDNVQINWSIKLRRIKDFGGRGHSILNLGLNPFSMLYDVLFKKIDYEELHRKVNEFNSYYKNQNKTLSSKHTEKGKKKMKKSK